MNKNLIFFAKNNLIYDSLVDNCSYDIKLKESNYLSSSDKIDLLIIDIPFSFKNFKNFLFKINFIISLSDDATDLPNENTVFLQKPLKFSYLIKLIESKIKNNFLFTRLNNHWIYREDRSCLLSENDKINFSNKENLIFKEMLKSENNTVEKDFLKTDIFNYNINIETNTLDTHLYRLKQKLPKNWLNISGTRCSLKIL